MRSLLVLPFVLACGGAPSPSPDLADAALPDVDASPPDADVPPAPPERLQRWLVGDPDDVIATPRAGLIVMGGGTDVDDAFAWQRDRIDGGDVVVLRASGADGYNDYLFGDIGGVDSVETLVVDERALADEPYVRWTLAHAEAIFVAGGDQSVYVDAWRDTALAEGVAAARQRGAVLGGTSAGAAILGEIVYTAANGSVYSDEALADPYDPHMTFAPALVGSDHLAGVVVDTHFAARDRMGRLVAFVARAIADGRAARPLGLGVDEATAVLVDERGGGRVVGAGAVYVVAPTTPPETCEPGAPLAWTDVPLHALRAGDTIALPSGDTAVAPTFLSTADGALDPADPY
jgi:cyanophycinase